MSVQRLLAAVLLLCASIACGGSDNQQNLIPPTAPTNLTATGGEQKVDLAWTASATATGYKVARAPNSGGPYTQVGTPTGTSYSDTGLTASTTYFYVVQAVNAAGTSEKSNEASATTNPPAANPPAAPTGLTATGGDARIDLSWSASATATTYVVRRASTSSGPFTDLATASTTTYADTGLAASTTFFYVVRAANA
ncbi:MAG: fibronectin type III domain-containing protein, partial [Deltaproteobacteria bacterium]|nr:fibronectin type III domain-containing protein [Deltaproteobacteria bacterium]